MADSPNEEKIHKKNILCEVCGTYFNPKITRIGDYLDEKSRRRLANNLRAFLCENYTSEELTNIYQILPADILSLREDLYMLSEFNIKLVKSVDMNAKKKTFYEDFVKIKYPVFKEIDTNLKQFFMDWSTNLRKITNHPNNKSCPLTKNDDNMEF